MAETTTIQKVVTLESLGEASKLLATKEEVKQQIADAVATCVNIAYASTEEVLSLFKPTTGGTEESGNEA